MGADLYIQPLFAEQRKQWKSLLDQARARCDRLPEGSPEHAQAKQEVERYYQKLCERGYFRDPYNGWDLLWKFGLSWWEDIVPLLDDKAWLSVQQAQKVLAMLAEREPIFEQSLAELPEADQQYFRKRYRAFQRFLSEAIRLNIPIVCSL